MLLKKGIGKEANGQNINDLKLQKANEEKIAKENLEAAKKLAEEMKDKEIRVSGQGRAKADGYSDPYRRKRSQRRSKSSLAMRSIRKRFYWMHR